MKKILIVEDNRHHLRLLKKILTVSGYETFSAETGEDGVQLAKANKPDLILMNIRLPGIDGIKAAKKLKASKGFSEIPVLALTSYAMLGDRERFLKAGFDGYLEKPINPYTFVQDIEKYVR